MARQTTTLWIISLLAALALFAGMLYQAGVGAIGASLRLLGVGVVIPVVACGVRYLFRTLAWFFCIEPSERHCSIFALFNIRLAGETVGELLPVGLFLGESTKAVIASRRIPGVTPYASIVIENIIFGMSVIIILLGGSALLFVLPGVSQTARIAGCLTAALLLLPSILVVVGLHRRWMLISNGLSMLQRRQIRWDWFQRHTPVLLRFEEAIYGFYRKHTSQFYGIVVLEFCASCVGVFEAFWILRTAAGGCSLSVAFLAEFTGRMINSLFSFIPLRLGVDEGGAALLLQSVGYSVSAGVSLAVVRKIRTIFWMIPGLFLLGRYSIFRPNERVSG